MKRIIFYSLFLVFLFNNNVIAKDKFMSLKNSKVNVRYGPGFDSPVKYVYKKLNLPVKLIDKTDLFMRVIDLKNNSGWIHWTQLKDANSIIILKNKILFKKPSNFSKPIVRLEKGRLLIVNACRNNWCNVTTEEYSGWIKADKVWGKTN